jgi:hypothetical protein
MWRWVRGLEVEAECQDSEGVWDELVGEGARRVLS